MTRGLLGTLRNVATLPSILGLLWTLSFLSLSTSLARADQMEWSQKAGGGGAVIQPSATCGTTVACTASDGGTYRLHSAVLQSSTVLNAASGSWNLTSGYMTTFPPRPLVKCRNNADNADCTTWQNDTTLKWRNDRNCASNCSFSKGALHYYKYKWSEIASETTAAIDSGANCAGAACEWSDLAGYCPGGCDQTGTKVNQAVTESNGWYLHVISYNGGLKGGQVAYGPFGIDQTLPNAPTISSPATSDWFQTGFTASVTDSDTGAVQSGVSTCQYQVESNNGGWVVTQTYASRTCTSATPSITVGSASPCDNTAANKCCVRGKDKCQVTVRATDAAGNTGLTTSRTFSADWLITNINNSIGGPVTGYPASAIDSSTAYLATYVGGTDSSGNPTLYALSSTATTSSSCKLNDLGDCTSTTCGGAACGSTVGAPYWTYGADNFVYVTTTNGWIFKYRNNAGTLQIAPSGANGIWPLRIADKCSGATSRSITTEPVVDDKLVYFGASEAGGTCGAGQEFIFGFEINPTIYNADVGSDNKADEIVGVPGCGTTAKGVPTIRGTWPAAKFLHIGGDCSSKEIYRVKVDANNADCWRNLAGISSVEGWMTGPSGKLFFGTATGTIQFHALNNTESTALCPDPPVAGTDPYADLTGFPFAHAGGTAVKRGAIMNSQSDLDEVYFVDDNGSLYCVCQIQGSSAARGCPTVGASCKKNDGATNFTVAVGGGGTPLREPLRDTATGTLYVLTNKAKVYAYESLYDPAGGGTCGAGEYTNCDGTNPGTEVGAAQGYPFDLGDNGATITAASTVALRNVGGAKLIAVGTDQGRVFYLPIVP